VFFSCFDYTTKSGVIPPPVKERALFLWALHTGSEG